LTRAKADTDDNQTYQAIIDRVYTDEFLLALKVKFDFDAPRPDLAQQIRRIGRNYIFERRFEDDIDRDRKSRESYRAFLKVTEPFLEWLKKSYEHPDFYNIATEMLMISQGRNEPEPQSQFPDLSEHERRVEAHYRELVRLTELLKATLTHRIDFLKPKRGPKRDFALEHLVISAAVFWTFDLGRGFTLDHHKGAGLTKAFEFVRTLAKPLDDIPDDKIITAMRTEIAERGKGIPT
jgi:hypothetical protein